MVSKKEVSDYLIDKIERIEAFEEKLGIKYDSVSVNVEYDDFYDDP